MMKRKHTILAVVVLAMLASLPATAKADPFTFNLLNPIQQTTSPGSTIVFRGTFTNGGPPTVFLNGSSLTVNGQGVGNDDDFFLNVAGTALASGASLAPVDIFRIVLAPGVYGTVSGSFVVQGGPNANAFNDLATRDFSIQVVPEPAAMVLFGTGLVGAAAAGLRKRRQAKIE